MHGFECLFDNSGQPQIEYETQGNKRKLDLLAQPHHDATETQKSPDIIHISIARDHITVDGYQFVNRDETQLQQYKLYYIILPQQIWKREHFHLSPEYLWMPLARSNNAPYYAFVSVD